MLMVLPRFFKNAAVMPNPYENPSTTLTNTFRTLPSGLKRQ